MIKAGFSTDHRSITDGVAAFRGHRKSLYVSDGVTMYQDHVVIPPFLRHRVLQTLHAANQGISEMKSRARTIVFWPGIAEDIHIIRKTCSNCNRSVPSQAATPSIPSEVPITPPFKSVFVDFFDCGGQYHLVAWDRLSGWVEIFRTTFCTTQAGAAGLIACLASSSPLLFSTFQ